VVDLAGFVALAVLVIVTPGPDTALTIRSTLAGGRRAGTMTALGVAFGQVCWALATSVGLSALLVAAEPVFAALKLAGAAYLVFLGAQSLWSAVRRRSNSPTTHLPSGASSSALRQGLVSNLSNPKMAVFFPSLLPQFVALDSSAFVPLLTLGFIFAAMTLSWLAGYAVLVARAGDLLRRSRIRRAFEAATGAVLIAFGVRVAIAR
jgi:threonine/homoserine/homoserine lactone efflux protein